MMRNFLFPTFFFILFLSVFTVKAQKKQYGIIAIAFYNPENLFDAIDDPKKHDDAFTPDGSNHYTAVIYQQKLHNLATVIAQLATEVTPDGPALIGSAEVENDRVLQDLVTQPEIKGRNYKFVHFESPDSRGIDVALLYHPKYFRVLKAVALYTDIRAYGNKGRKTRDVLYVTGLLAGDTTHIFVNHWPSRKDGEAASAPLRAAAARVNKRVIDSLMQVNPGTKVIVMGDLNDNPTDASVAKVLGAQTTKEKVALNGLYNPWAAFYNQGIGSLAYNDVWYLFDQIILSGAYLKGNAQQWQYYKAAVFNRAFLKEKGGRYKGYPLRSFSGNTAVNGYSDHFPTLVYLIRSLPECTGK